MKIKNVILSYLGLSLILLSSCAKIYYSPDAEKLAAKHQIVAIAPPKVSIAARKKVDAEAIKEQQKLESANFQKEICSWMLRRKMQNKIFVEVMDVETTNAKLQKAGYFDGTIMTPNEICEALGVDGLITSNFSLSKPMSEGGAIALGILFGAWTSTNQTQVSMEIHDRANKKMIWNYNHEASGSIGSSPSQLVDGLMRNASRKMPYIKK